MIHNEKYHVIFSLWLPLLAAIIPSTAWLMAKPWPILGPKKQSLATKPTATEEVDTSIDSSHRKENK